MKREGAGCPLLKLGQKANAETYILDTAQVVRQSVKPQTAVVGLAISNLAFIRFQSFHGRDFL